MELNNFMFERWMMIDGYINYYVSNFGRVINMTTKRILKPALRSGYLCVGLCKNGKMKTFPIHRLVALCFIVNPNDYICVDHIDTNKTNNSPTNLRWCTNQMNIMNSRKHMNTTSKFKGVSFYKRDKKWVAHIRHNQKGFHLGYFKTQEEAGRAYNEKASELFGEFAKLNVF